MMDNITILFVPSKLFFFSAENNSEVTGWLSLKYLIIGIYTQDALLKFHEILNSIDSNITFTIESEANGQIAFLDTLITREDGTINVDVYQSQKPNPLRA